MTTQTAKVKNGTIVLPKKFRKAWKKADVFMNISGDTILIKRLTQPALSLKEMMDEFRQVARKTKLSKKDVATAIQEVRREFNK